MTEDAPIPDARPRWPWIALAAVLVAGAVTLLRRGPGFEPASWVDEAEPARPEDRRDASLEGASREAEVGRGGRVALLPAGETVGHATVTLLSLADLAPAAASGWRLTGGAGDALVRVADEHGALDLPAGRWSIESADGGWAACQPVVELGRDERRTLYVQPVGTRRFRVTDLDGRPLDDVDVAWAPRRFDAEGLPLAGAAVHARSDADGRATVGPAPSAAGVAAFRRAGYRGRELVVSGPAGEVVDVALEPGDVRRTLSFVSLADGSPVADARLEVGEERTRLGPGEGGRFELPTWVAPDDVLRVTSPSTFPCQLRAGERRDRVVVLPGRRTVVVRVLDPAGRTERCTLGATVDAVAVRELEVEPLLGPRRSAVVGDAVELALPLELATTLAACGTLGRSARRVVEPFARGERVDLTLERGPGLVLRAFDASGAPVASFLARTSVGDELVSDGTGTLHVPHAVAGASLTVRAEGFAPTVLSRRRPLAPPSGDVPLDVTLARRARATFRVTAASGEPLAGLFVRVSPHPTRSAVADPEAAWVADQVRVSDAGVTDGDGLWRASALREGPATVEVGLAPALGSDAYLRSLLPAASFPVDVRAGAAHAFVVPRPRNVTLQVLEAGSGRPVLGFALSDAGSGGVVLQVAGHVWQGWISERTARLRIEVAELGVALVDVPTGVDRLEAVVGPGARLRLQVEGLQVEGWSESAAGATLDVSILRLGEDGLHRVGSRELRLDELGAAWIALEGDVGDLRFHVETKRIGGRRVRFEPEFQRPDAAGQVRFRVLSD